MYTHAGIILEPIQATVSYACYTCCAIVGPGVLKPPIVCEPCTSVTTEWTVAGKRFAWEEALIALIRIYQRCVLVLSSSNNTLEATAL